VAAVIAAAGTLAAVFDGGGDGGDGGDGGNGRDSRSGGGPQVSSPGSPAESEPPPELSPGDAQAAGAASAGCFGGPFARIPQGRLAPVEAGTTSFDIVTSSEPKAGPIGLRFTDHERTVGGIRSPGIPSTTSSGSSRSWTRVAGPSRIYADVVERGQKDVMENSDTLRIRLAGRYYDLRLTGGSRVWVAFLQVER
jgi:hypothetical protein